MGVDQQAGYRDGQEADRSLGRQENVALSTSSSFRALTASLGVGTLSGSVYHTVGGFAVLPRALSAPSRQTDAT